MLRDTSKYLDQNGDTSSGLEVQDVSLSKPWGVSLVKEGVSLVNGVYRHHVPLIIHETRSMIAFKP